MDDAEIHLLVAGQGGPVRRPARERGSETAAGSEVEGKPSVIRKKRILDAGRGCVSLVVIGVDGVSCNKGEVVGREVELPRYDFFPSS